MNKSVKIIAILVLLSLISGGRLMAQNNPNPCEAPEFSQFDFWLGEWDLTWTGPDGEIQKGTNTITKILDSCVIEENFDGSPGITLKGKSISTYSTQRNAWIQIWVDNQGGYLDFSGQYAGGKMILSRQAERNGTPIFQRMVWYNISSDELDWSWEGSADGVNWNVDWYIHYKRK